MHALQIEATSEDEVSIGAVIAFSPDGGLLASTRQAAGKHEVIFFEPNGLRHYEFALGQDCTEASVSQMSWNIDGTRVYPDEIRF